MKTQQIAVLINLLVTVGVSQAGDENQKAKKPDWPHAAAEGQMPLRQLIETCVVQGAMTRTTEPGAMTAARLAAFLAGATVRPEQAVALAPPGQTVLDLDGRVAGLVVADAGSCDPSWRRRPNA